MRIYTRSGDSGETSLFGGGRVSKDNPRVRAYGESDELNSMIGWCATIATGELVEQLRREQQRLLDFGAHLATPNEANDGARSMLPTWDEGAASLLESEIDAAEAKLPPLKNFILPGGNELSARLHIARSVCRRCEREVCALPGEWVTEAQLAWLNRLSDWLFVQARLANE